MNTSSPALPIETTVGNHFVSNYPPFSVWHPEAVPALLDVLRQPCPMEPLSLYVHIPFCRQRCHYCYFRVYPRSSPEDVREYVDHLLKEFSLYQDCPAVQRRAFHSVYFGGGTPSYLSVEEIERLFTTLQSANRWIPGAECTYECEPGTVDPAKFKLLKEMGVTRLSLGFQTLNNDILRRSGRDLTSADCIEAFEQARDAGFDQINIDLLAGLPGENTRTWRTTIDRVVDLAPDCVTIYQLELTHNSNFFRTMQVGRELQLVDWPAKRQWVREAFETFEHLGYSIVSGYMAVRAPAKWRFAYTADHFWKGQDLLALGEASFGHFQGVHYQNHKTCQPYFDQLQRNELPLWRAYVLNPEEALRREVILHLKTGHLTRSYFQKKFGVDVLAHFAEQWKDLYPLCEISDDKIQLTREALLEVDWLLPRFFLPEHRKGRYT